MNELPQLMASFLGLAFFWGLWVTLDGLDQAEPTDIVRSHAAFSKPSTRSVVVCFPMLVDLEKSQPFFWNPSRFGRLRKIVLT